jgi:hypothetical protein
MARLKGSKDKEIRKQRAKEKFCSKGHNISVVGRTKSGNCKKCQSDYYKERREFIRKYFNKKAPKI